jgi:hypothetical protein
LAADHLPIDKPIDYPKNSFRQMLLGCFSVMSIYWPLFGRSFSLFGIPNRIIGFLLLFFVFILMAGDIKWKALNHFLMACLISLFFCCCAYASWVQFQNIIPSAGGSYQDTKLGMFLFYGMPPCFLGYIASGYIPNKHFLSGLFKGIIIVSIIALVLLIFNREFFLAANSDTDKAFDQEGLFSTISFSLVVSLGAIGMIQHLFIKKRITFIGVAFFLLLSIAVILLRQRAHLIFIGLFFLYTCFRDKRSIKIGITTLIAIGLVIFIFKDQILGDTVVRYWEVFFSGDALENRKVLIAVAFSEATNSPFGLGLASYAKNFWMDYPHNILFEAFYELGIFGAIIVIAILTSIIFNLFRMWIKNTKIPGSYSLIAALVLFNFLHSMKAGELSSIGLLVFWGMLLSPHNWLRGDPQSNTHFQPLNNSLRSAEQHL